MTLTNKPVSTPSSEIVRARRGVAIHSGLRAGDASADAIRRVKFDGTGTSIGG